MIQRRVSLVMEVCWPSCSNISIDVFLVMSWINAVIINKTHIKYYADTNFLETCTSTLEQCCNTAPHFLWLMAYGEIWLSFLWLTADSPNLAK